MKTLTGRPIARDPLQSADGWNKFAAGFAVGGLSGVAWAYILVSQAAGSWLAPGLHTRTLRV